MYQIIVGVASILVYIYIITIIELAILNHERRLQFGAHVYRFMDMLPLCIRKEILAGNLILIKKRYIYHELYYI